MNQVNLHLALKDLEGGVFYPSDYAGLLWFQWYLKLKHFKPNLCSKEVSLCVRYVFIYIQTSECMAVKKNNLCITSCSDTSHSHMHSHLCLCMRKYLTTLHSLSLHTDTQRATREHRLLGSFAKGGVSIGSYLPNYLSYSSFYR